MSKIYKALEKAEREREKERPSGEEPSVMVQLEAEEKRQVKEEIAELLKVAGVVSDQRLVSLFQPGSLASEQFRKLRTHLFRNGHPEPPKTIMVTSATSGEGKTFVSANLAIGIVHDLHAHALLVDCDLRKPSLPEWFGIRSNKGLSDYLLGDGSVSDLLIRTDVEKLSILPSGTAQGKPTELIGSRRMETLVRELKSRYSDRYIILDCTPLLATTEPEVLGRLVDGILIVVRAGVTVRETLKHAIAPLEKAKIMGFVLNDVEMRSSGLSHRYFGASGYYYNYGYSGGTQNSRRGWKKLFRSIHKSD